MHCRVADDPLGPFPAATDRTLVADETGSLYAAKLVQDPHGEWVLLATRMYGPDGSFVGALSDPIPLTVSKTGLLSVSQH